MSKRPPNLNEKAAAQLVRQAVMLQKYLVERKT